MCILSVLICELSPPIIHYVASSYNSMYFQDDAASLRKVYRSGYACSGPEAHKA